MANIKVSNPFVRLGVTLVLVVVLMARLVSKLHDCHLKQMERRRKINVL